MDTQHTQIPRSWYLVTTAVPIKINRLIFKHLLLHSCLFIFLSKRNKICNFHFYNIALSCIPLLRSSWFVVIHRRNIMDKKKLVLSLVMTILLGAITFFSFGIKCLLNFLGVCKIICVTPLIIRKHGKKCGWTVEVIGVGCYFWNFDGGTFLNRPRWIAI